MELLVGLFTLIGVVFGAVIHKSIADRSNYLEYITRERQAWRCELRSYIEELFDGKCHDYRSLRAKFEVRLNPTDDHDKKILGLFDDLMNAPVNDQDYWKGRISEEVAHLLKHDWERVKTEAGPRIKPYHVGLGAFWFLVAYSYFSLWAEFPVVDSTAKSPKTRDLLT